MSNRLRRACVAAVGLGLVFLGLSSCGKKEQKAGADTGASTAMMPDTSANRSLYDRPAGKSPITAGVDTFVTRVAADARITKKFPRSTIPLLKTDTVYQACPGNAWR